jgi:uncharacterized membrane protein YfcA
VTVLYLALGAVSGILAGLFGIGGGVVMVLGMVSVMKLPLPVATGTSLAAMLLPVGLLGALEYHRHGQVDLRGALLLAAGLTAGAWVGARLAHQAPTVLVQRGFAVFLLLMAVRIWTTAG